MAECSECALWVTRESTRYSDGSVVDNRESPEGKGLCGHLHIETVAQFGCNLFVIRNGGGTVRYNEKFGSPWQHWEMIACPDCGGKGSPHAGETDQHGTVPARSCNRCAGTGQVRKYDDGFIGEEQTRLHPRERNAVSKPKCPNCQREVDREWKVCPTCAARLDGPSSTEIIKDTIIS